jgi:hypothetical protein
MVSSVLRLYRGCGVRPWQFGLPEKIQLDLKGSRHGIPCRAAVLDSGRYSFGVLKVTLRAKPCSFELSPLHEQAERLGWASVSSYAPG